jgi:hypothetical protein
MGETRGLAMLKLDFMSNRMCEHLLHDIVVIPQTEPAGVLGVPWHTQNLDENFGINSSLAIPSRFSCLEIKNIA